MVLEIYNERNQPECSVHLTNKVQTLNNVSGINISLPSGTIKLNLREYATHIKLMYHGLQWVLAVTGRESLGNDLYLINYTVDWLKDYWLKYADKSGNYVISRTTNTSYISRFIPDNLFPFNGDFTMTTEEGRNVYGPQYIVVIAPCNNDDYPQVYSCDKTGLEEVQSALLWEPEFNKALVSMYIAPSGIPATLGGWIDEPYFSYPGTRTRDTTIEYVTKHVPIQPMATSHISKLTYASKNNFWVAQTLLTIPKTDWRDMYATKYALYIPYIGMVNVDSTRINGSIQVHYMIDYASGTIKAMLNNDRSTLTASCALPTIPIVSGADVVTAVRTAQIQYNANQQRVVTDALLGLGGGVVGGAMAGGGLGAAGGALFGGIVSGMGSEVRNRISYDAAIQSAAIGGVSVSSVSAYEGLLHNKFYLVTLKPIENMTMAQHIAATGAPSQKYIEHLTDLGDGYYWLDCSSAVMYGGQYANQYRAAIHGQRIYV